MSGTAFRGVCRRCERRCWLVSRLGQRLEALADDPARFWPTLELEDCELIAALVPDDDGQRAEWLKKWERWCSNRDSAQRGVLDGFGRFDAVCRHHCRYPGRLQGDTLAPHALVALVGSGDGGGRWDVDLRESKIVAIAGARSPSHYGVDVARALAIKLAAAGVTVAGSASGVGAAALAAADDAGGIALGIFGYGALSGVGQRPGELGDHGSRACSFVEPVAATERWHWPTLAAERTLALIADLVLVVQARADEPLDLACVEVACLRGIPVAAVPGPVDSPASRGSNSLIAGGARVVCDAREALDALFAVGVGFAPTGLADGHRSRTVAPRAESPSPHSGCHRSEVIAPVIGPGSRAVLDLIAVEGRTLGELCRALDDADQTAIAVAELELSGLAVRGDDGRYRAAAPRRRR